MDPISHSEFSGKVKEQCIISPVPVSGDERIGLGTIQNVANSFLIPDALGIIEATKI